MTPIYLWNTAVEDGDQVMGKAEDEVFAVVARPLTVTASGTVVEGPTNFAALNTLAKSNKQSAQEAPHGSAYPHCGSACWSR